MLYCWLTGNMIYYNQSIKDLKNLSIFSYRLKSRVKCDQKWPGIVLILLCGVEVFLISDKNLSRSSSLRRSPSCTKTKFTKGWSSKQHKASHVLNSFILNESIFYRYLKFHFTWEPWWLTDGMACLINKWDKADLNVELLYLLYLTLYLKVITYSI